MDTSSKSHRTPFGWVVSQRTKRRFATIPDEYSQPMTALSNCIATMTQERETGGVPGRSADALN